MDGRRHELTRPEPPVLVGESARETPAFRLHVVRSVRMRPVLAGSVAAAVFVLLVVYALVRKPAYTAESLIYVEPLEVRVLTDGSSSGYDPSRYDSYLQQQVQTVERADTLEAAVAKIPAGVWGPPEENIASAARRLLSSLKVDRVLNSYELGIDVTASTPAAAAAGANAVAAAYLEQGRKDEHARADQRLQLLTEERQRITDDMTEDKAEQATLGRNLGVANPNGASGNPYDLQSEGLRSQLAAAREAHDAVAAQLASVAGQNGNGLETAANEMILTDAGLVSIRQTLSQRRAVLSDQMGGLTPANPVYKQDQEEIANLDRAMERATQEARQRAERQLQDKLRLDLGRTADVEGRLNAQLAQQTSKATGAGPKLQRAAELETDLQRLSTRFATVDDAIRGLQLETGGPGQAHLAMAARVPDSAQPSRSKLMLLLALPLALLFGAGAAVVARKRDPRLYLPGDMQEVLGFPPMCVLPSASEVSAEAYDEFVLRLAGGLEGAYRHGGARSFVFTPVSVGGRAVTMLPQLCKKLRQIGYRAVCVGADELMPGTAKTMESGTHEIGPVRAREGFATTKLERLLEEYDLVLVVAPPLLGSAVAEYTVRSADATILLVESTRTNRAELRRAAMLLERLNPQGIGAVLEDLPLQYADPVFRAAVQAADSWPMMPMKRAAEKVRTSSAVEQKAVTAHKPAAPEIRLPVAAAVVPVEEEVAEKAEVLQAPYVEERAEEKAETPAPAVVAAPAPPLAQAVSEQNAPARLEHARLYPIYKAANEPIYKAADEPIYEAADEPIYEAADEPIYEAPVERAPVPTPDVVAAVEPSAAPLMDEEPVSISTEFRPVSFHDASGPAQQAEIKYFIEKPLPGFESASRGAAISRAVAEPTRHEPLLPTNLQAEDFDWVGGAISPAESHSVEAFEETTGAPAIDSTVEAAPIFEADRQLQPVDLVEPHTGESFESPAELAEAQPDEGAVTEDDPTETRRAPVHSQAETSKESKPLSWFQRVFGADDEQAMRVTPVVAEPAVTKSEMAPEETGNPQQIAQSAVEEADRSNAVDADIAHETDVLAPSLHENVERSFRDTDEMISGDVIRNEPPIAFEESLWIRGTRAPETDRQPRVHFFLDLSPQPAVERTAEVKEELPEQAAEENGEAAAENSSVGVLHAGPDSLTRTEEFATRLEGDRAPVAEQEAAATNADFEQTQAAKPVVLELAPAFETAAQHGQEFAAGPIDAAEEIWPREESANLEREIAPVPAVTESPFEAHHHLAIQEREQDPLVALPVTAPELTPVRPEAMELSRSAAKPLHAEHDALRTEEHSVHDKKAAFVPFTPSIAPISSGQFPLRTLERTGGQRAGLARAMRQAGIDDGPSKKANEEHAPLRTGSGLRKAAVRQEAVLRAHVQPAEPLSEQAGMRRRWGMLSRFERIGPSSETGGRDESDLAGAAPRNGTDSSK